jgi:hypothetical protein
VAVVGAHLGDHLLVALDAPEGTDVVSVDEAVLLLLCLREGESRGESAQDELSPDVHYLLNGEYAQPNIQ